MTRLTIGLVAVVAVSGGCDPSTGSAPAGAETDGTADTGRVDDGGDDGAGPTSGADDGGDADSGPSDTTAAATDGSTSAVSTSAAETDDTGADETTAAASGPIILELSSNITELDDESTVRLTAIVTDPDGIRDVIGGSLTNDSGTVTFGALATESQEGAYTIELSWDEINLADPLYFTGSETRTFVARFFDTEGTEESATIDLTFACEFADGACDGVCMSLQNTSACGACDVQCEGFESCVQSSCALDFSCDPLGIEAQCASDDCHTTGTGFWCVSSGDGVQGDTCENGCAAGFDCFSVGVGGGFECYGYCMLDDDDCTGGTSCNLVGGIPLWDGMGLCT